MKVSRIEMFVGRNDLTRNIALSLAFIADGNRMYLIALEDETERPRSYFCTATNAEFAFGNSALKYIGSCSLAPGIEYHLFEVNKNEEA